MSVSTKIPPRKPRIFLPEEFQVNNWVEVAPYYDLLLREPLDTASQLEGWLLRATELEFVLSEDLAWRYIRMTCDTRNEAHKDAYQHFLQEIQPNAALKENELQNKLYGSPAFSLLDPDKYLVLIRSVRNRIELFREENIPLSTEARQTASRFDEIAANLQVEIGGEVMTLQKAGSLLENRDRALRKEAWEKITSARLEYAGELDTVYSNLVRLRTSIARNAGFDNYSDYKIAALGRFDYGREECEQFHDSLEKVVRPLFLEMAETRRVNLGLDKLQHWDLVVDEFDNEPLKPFSDTRELTEKSIAILGRLHPEMGEQLSIMRDMGHLDLESRLGKAPGGYNYPLMETGVPFIFMNAVGTQGDLTTMVHEAGHAVHSFATRDLQVGEFKSMPSEVAELASMSMELLSMDHWDEFYDNPEDLRRARREQVLRAFSLLPWVASIDKFQFWAYDHPDHTPEERVAAWKEIFFRFHGDYVDWAGYEHVLDRLWQRQGHIYYAPFYYIEYAIAQLGAIAVWRNYRQDPDKALRQYMEALKMGYSRPIPEVYAAAGIRFDFSEAYIRELMDFLHDELRQLEA